jgi:transposase
MAQAIVGIDVSKLTLDVALLKGEKRYEKKFENSCQGYPQIMNWMGRYCEREVHVCLEATGQYGDGVAEYLHEKGCMVSVVNPARIKHYACSKLRRNKTDKADARLIAEYCLRENPAPWKPPTADFKRLQAFIRHLDDLQAGHQQTSNRMKSGVTVPEVVAQLKALDAVFLQQIEETLRLIQECIDHSPELKRARDLLISIPGIAQLTAARILGEVRDILDFESASQLAAYAGLTPREFTSGTSVHKKSRISKLGNAHLRKALYMPAIVSMKFNPIIRAFCARLKASGHLPKEVVCAAMHKLLHYAYGVLKTGQPFDPNYLAKMQLVS